MNEFKAMQLRALKRWEFEEVGKNEYATRTEGVLIQWNVQQQFGAYTFEGDLTLIHNWDELDSLMEQMEIY